MMSDTLVSLTLPLVYSAIFYIGSFSLLRSKVKLHVYACLWKHFIELKQQILTVAHPLDKILESLCKFSRLRKEHVNKLEFPF